MRSPCGSWKSPITATLITTRGVSLSRPRLEASGDIYWQEDRPLEAGRSVIVRRAAGGGIRDITPPAFNVRSRAHEYGGGSYLVHRGVVFFSNFEDQRLYRQDPDGDPRPITPEPSRPGGLRYADGAIAPDGRRIVCVRESHPEEGEAVNEIVVLPADGSAPPHAIVEGSDFYSFPRLSPDGSRLAWTQWDHPSMPWDGTTLWVAEFAGDGSIRRPRRVAGGPEESIFQPRWSPDGVLHFVSDRTGWWNLYKEVDGNIVALAPMEAEFGAPQWVFGLSTYTFLSEGRIASIFTESGVEHLAVVSRVREVRSVDTPFTSFGHGPELSGDGQSRLVFVAGSSTRPECIAVLDVDSGEQEVVKERFDFRIDPGYLSRPRRIEFPTGGGRTAFALFYPPANGDYEPRSGEKPPLIVVSHGGPTGASSSVFHPGIQFWTSRGLAVVDVNYGGSTGYGRQYRELLKGRWGLVDTEDCIHAARYLETQAEVDGARMAIRGGSAGGYTALCALVFHDVFAAGASYYGVADLEALVRETHKFESRYLDGLVGPYPEAAQIYRERSPIHHTHLLSCPIILLQGLDDRVVPPSQAELMVDALRRKRLPFAYLAFEGEQHGFRRAENIRRAIESELYFYGRVFGFEPADDLEPIPIENL